MDDSGVEDPFNEPASTAAMAEAVEPARWSLLAICIRNAPA